jgi:hypothetical protein
MTTSEEIDKWWNETAAPALAEAGFVEAKPGFIVDLDDVAVDCVDPAVVTLQMLTAMHNETHRRWWATPNGGAWDYEKASATDTM